MFNFKNKYLYCCLALILLLIITFGIKLFNNYYDTMSIKEIKKNTIVLKNNKDTSNDGHLVLLNGKIKTSNGLLNDDLFNTNVESTRLFRNVEVYQWIEYKEKDKNGKIVYKYKAGWFDQKIDSSEFRKKNKVNPNKWQYKAKYINPEQIKIGNFELSKSQIKKIPCNIRLKLGSNNILKDGFIIYDNYFTNSIDPEKPKVGDYRISYYYNNWDYITVLALQKNNSFEDYITKKGEKVNIIAGDKFSLNQLEDSINKELKK